jgi:hypothetical protein
MTSPSRRRRNYVRGVARAKAARIEPVDTIVSTPLPADDPRQFYIFAPGAARAASFARIREALDAEPEPDPEAPYLAVSALAIERGRAVRWLLDQTDAYEARIIALDELAAAQQAEIERLEAELAGAGTEHPFIEDPERVRATAAAIAIGHIVHDRDTHKETR